MCKMMAIYHNSPCVDYTMILSLKNALHKVVWLTHQTHHNDGLVQDYSNSKAKALELL